MTVAKFRAVATDGANGGADLVVNKPSGTVDDDIMIAVGVSWGQSIAPPGGWTEFYLEPTTNDFGIWWRRASSEGSSYTFVTSGGANPRAARASILSYSGCPTGTNPIIGVLTKQSSAGVMGAGMTPSANAAIVLHVGACADATVDVVSSTPPPGMTEREDERSQHDVGGDCQVQLAVSEAYLLPYADTGDRSATLSASKPNWGALVILYQTPLTAGTPDGSGQETLLELTHWDEIAAAETTKKYSSRGVTFTGGEHYEPRILSGIEIAQVAADRIVVGGLVATTISDVRLNNKDGALDAIFAKGLALGRTAVVKTVQVTSPTSSDLGAGAASNAVTCFSGIVGAMRPQGDDMIVSITDKSERLNVPLQIDEYPGTSGLGGDVELKGLTKPATFGRAWNVLPQELGNFSLGDGSLYTYQVHSRPFNNIVAVYERGVAMTEIASAPGAGQYREWLNDGVFQLGFTPNGIITATVKGDDPASEIYANQHGEILTRMITLFGPELATSELETDTFSAVDTELPGEIGIYFAAGDRSTCRDACERVLHSGGIWLSGGRNGKLRLAMAIPVASERLKLSDPQIMSLKPVALPAALQPAPSTIHVQTEKNWHPFTDISSSVTGSLRRKFTGSGRTVESVSTILETRQKPPRAWNIESLWFNDSDGQVRADQIRAWVELGLVAFEVATDRYLNQVELGMGCEIESYPKYGLEGGFAGIVSAWRERPADGRVTMLLIGALASGVILLEDGSPLLMEDGGYILME